MSRTPSVSRARGAAGHRRPSPRLHYAAHIDEGGFIHFKPVGGFDPGTLPSQRGTIRGTKNRRNTLQGVIAPQPRWMPGEDVNASVHVGDIVSLAKEFEVLNDRIVTGRNIDDRIGVYCMVETVDGSLAADIPYAKPHQRQCPIGEGIYIMDTRTMGDSDLLAGLISTCEKHEIPYHRNLGGGTDASIAQRTGFGAKATTIGAPTRYMHSTVQMCHMRDVEATIDLPAVFARYAADVLPADWR